MSNYSDSKMNPEAPPPPYTAPAPQDSGGSPARGLGGAAEPQPQSQLQCQFPPKFNLYSTSPFDGRSYTLGEHRSQPLYAVAMHSGLSGQPSTILYSGASDQTAPLGTADGTALSSATTIELFLPGGAGPCTYQAESGGGFAHRTLRFDVEVGGGGNGGRETFEWRHSKGDEVRALGKQLQGWKLVWLGSGGGGGGGGSSSSSAGGPKSSDGNGVVAVWAHGHMSRSKFFCFQFVGSGLGSGMGDRWTLVTILTALRMWDRERAQRVHTVSVGGGGA